MTAPPTPYRDAAPVYRDAGWSGVIPLPYASKRLVLTGWTGHGGAWPSFADVQAWCDSDAADEGGGNIALRLPPDVVGIDVDAYSGKKGAATFAAAVAKWGPLPATWTSTARDDGISGIQLFRIPEGLRWPGELGPHVEIIYVGYRYLVVWPSVHPDTGGRYRWIRPDGLTSTVPPTPDDLPKLPPAWVAGITRGELAEEVRHADLGVDAVRGWIVGHHRSGMCRAMRITLEKLLGELATGSAHESLSRLFGLARLAEQGHNGLVDALQVTHTAFLAEATRPNRAGKTRSSDDAEGEWRRSLAGAVRRVVGSPSVGPGEQPVDPCSDPFAGLVDPAYLAPAPPRLANPPTPAAQIPAEPPAGHPAGADTPRVVFAAEGDTWRRRDLRAALRGRPVVPTLFTYGDGRALFYPGKINGFLGESEAGKSWLALLAVAQEIHAGRTVVYVDFEDTDVTLARRLLMLGVDENTLVDRVAYIGPEESLTAAAADILDAEVATSNPSLVVLDGVNAAMTRLGLDSNSTTDATRFAQTLLARLVVGGAGVVTLDHVGKNKETRGKGGIGSQAKRAMVDGALVACEIVTPLGRGKSGRIRLVVDKDRHGGIEYVGAGRYIGSAKMVSTTDPDRVRIGVELPDDRPYEERIAEPNIGLMRKISAHLASSPEGLSGNKLENEVKGDRLRIRAAVAALIDAKCVEQQQRTGRGGGSVYVHVAHYRPDVDDLVDRDEDDE